MFNLVPGGLLGVKSVLSDALVYFARMIHQVILL